MMRVTAAGSLPGTDFAGALRAMGEQLPELLPWPELPARGVESQLIGRTLGLIDGLSFDVQPAGWRLTQHSGREQRRATTQWRSDLDDAEEVLQDFSGEMKVALAGPWTLAAGIERPRGDRMIADHGARRELAEALHEAATGLLSELSRRLPQIRPVLQIDEPSLIAVADGAVPTASGFSRHRAVGEAELSHALAPLGGLDVATVLHCCAPGQWLKLARSAAFDAVAIDVRLFGGTASRDALGTWLGEGRQAHVGVVDTASCALQGRDQLVTAALGLLRSVEIEPDSLAPRVVLGTACGMAGWMPSDVTAQLRELREAASLVAEHLHS